MGNAATYHFEIEQGATWKKTLTLKNPAGVLIDLTGYTALLQVRKNEASSSTFAELTHTDGLTLGGDLGTIVINFSATLTATFTFDIAKYDLKITSGSEVTRLLEGNIILDKQVSR